MFYQLACEPNLTQSQDDETDSNIEFLQPYPIVVADALLEICTALVSSALSLKELLSQTKIVLTFGVLLP